MSAERLKGQAFVVERVTVRDLQTVPAISDVQVRVPTPDGRDEVRSFVAISNSASNFNLWMLHGGTYRGHDLLCLYRFGTWRATAER